MINWNIAKTWENWPILFLMFAIPATVVHFILTKFDTDEGNN